MAGYWLNPDRHQLVEVPDTHDAFVRDKNNALSLGLSESVYETIIQHPPTAVDEIRLLAVQAGLVRIREHRRYTSIQFAAERERVTSILRAVVEALSSVQLHPDTFLKIDNLLPGDSTSLTFADLAERLDKSEIVL